MRVLNAIALVLVALAIAGSVPSPALAAPATGIVRTHSALCTGVGWLSGLAGTVCKVASHPKTVIDVGKKLFSGNPGGALKDILGSPGAGRAVAAAAVLATIVAWVTGGAHAALQATAHLISTSSHPDLLSTWFSGAYWRVAAVSALLTLPFLFAAAVQALLRSDLALLARAAFGYLPLGMLAAGVAAPVTMLLLGASDEMSSIVSSASGHADGSFLAHAGVAAGAVAGAAISPFVAFFVALLTVAGAVTLWLELLIREAAVYVIVLMLPLFFAALVWPARRIWALRAVELLVALILSKFAIVAVLSLGGAALDHAAALSVTSLLAGLALVLMAAFTPWALLRLLPLHEMASAAASGLHQAPVQRLGGALGDGHSLAGAAEDFVGALPERLQEMVRDARGGGAHERPALPATHGEPESRPSEDRVEAAAEEAATAVAASGGGSMSTTDGPPAAPDSSGDQPATADAPPGHLSAHGMKGTRPIWRSDWQFPPLEEGADLATPVAEIGEPGAPPVLASDDHPAPPPAVEPPTLPDAEPRPPAADRPDPSDEAGR